MIKEIVKGEQYFKVAENAVKADLPCAFDLADTLRANSECCVGMAANMIGINKRIIAVYDDEKILIMLNPVIKEKSAKTYVSKEGCLSLEGERETVRHQTVVVEYYDEKFKKRRKAFTGFTACIIQHETDHCNGIII